MFSSRYGIDLFFFSSVGQFRYEAENNGMFHSVLTVSPDVSGLCRLQAVK